MSRRRRSRKKGGGGGLRVAARSGGRRPKAGYREYLERCRAAGREPTGFEEFLKTARRWRAEYEPALERGDKRLAGELEDLLCERGAQGLAAGLEKRGRRRRDGRDTGRRTTRRGDAYPGVRGVRGAGSALA